MSDLWPFANPRNCAVITLTSILRDGKPILHVSHDADDDGWQFLDGGIVQEEHAVVAALSEMVAQDPSLLAIADLPPGWCAARESLSSPWQRFPHPEDDSL